MTNEECPSSASHEQSACAGDPRHVDTRATTIRAVVRQVLNEEFPLAEGRALRHLHSVQDETIDWIAEALSADDEARARLRSLGVSADADRAGAA